MDQYDLAQQPAAQSCRLISFDKAEVRPGFVSGTWILIVSGEAPCLNMDVSLIPLIYTRCPEYWGIEVVGCLPQGICLRAVKPYLVTLQLTGITGSEGIEVIGSNKSEKFKVSGGCDAKSAWS